MAQQRWARVAATTILETKLGDNGPGGGWLACPDECTPQWQVTPEGAFYPPGPPRVPAAVTNFQARAVMMATPMPGGGSLFDAVDATLRAEGGVRWQAWEQANEFVRNGMMINGMAADFGMTQADIDRLFIAASTVTA